MSLFAAPSVPSFPSVPSLLMRGGRAHFGSQQFILIRSDVVDVRGDRGAPARSCRIQRAEVIAAKPSITAQLVRRCAIEGVEANPETIRVGLLDQRLQAVHLLRGPVAGVVLSIGLDDPPGIVPPAAVVVGLLGVEYLQVRPAGLYLRVWIAPKSSTRSPA